MDNNNYNRLIFSNQFGNIYESKLTLDSKYSIDETPLTQITLLSCKRERNFIMGILSVIAAFGFPRILTVAEQGSLNIKISIFILFIIIGIGYFIGNIFITIKGLGIDKKIKIDLSKQKEGIEFYTALKTQIYSLDLNNPNKH